MVETTANAAYWWRAIVKSSLLHCSEEIKSNSKLLKFLDNTAKNAKSIKDVDIGERIGKILGIWFEKLDEPIFSCGERGGNVFTIFGSNVYPPLPLENEDSDSDEQEADAYSLRRLSVSSSSGMYLFFILFFVL